jgi:hypothetical protein
MLVCVRVSVHGCACMQNNLQQITNKSNFKLKSQLIFQYHVCEYVCVYIYICVYVVVYRYEASIITPLSSFCEDKKLTSPQRHNEIAAGKIWFQLLCYLSS